MEEGKVIFESWGVEEWQTVLKPELLKPILVIGAEVKIVDDKKHLIVRIDEVDPAHFLKGEIVNCLEDPTRIGGNYLKRWEIDPAEED